MAGTSPLHSSFGCFYNHLKPLCHVHWSVIKSKRETNVDLIYLFFFLILGFTRYFTIQVALTKGVFPVARFATGFVAMMLGVIVTLTFGILLAGKLEQK